MPRLELAGLHRAIADQRPDQACLISSEGSLSWREMVSRSQGFSRFLRDSGLGQVDRPDPERPWRSNQQHLGICLRNCPEYLEAVLGAHGARLAPFNINYRYTDIELLPLLRDADVDALVFGIEFAERIETTVRKLEKQPLLIAVADRSVPARRAESTHDYHAVRDRPNRGGRDTVPSPDDLHLLFTGGTTGIPRGVLWRIGDLVAGPLGVRERDGRPITELSRALERANTMGGVVLSAAPFMHGAGLWFALGGWLSGASVVVPPAGSFDGRALVETLVEHEVTSLMIVGDAFGNPLLEALRTASVLPHHLQTILNSGAALRDDLAAEFKRILPNVAVIDTLGSSETGQQATRAAGKAFRPRPGTVILDGQRTRILEPGTPEIGWLAQRGPIPLGYLNDEERTRHAFPVVGGQRVALSGDRARFLDDSSIELLGRDATTINTGGEKVFVEEVEAVLRSVPGVNDALVLGRTSPRWGSEIVALISPVPGAHLSDDCLRDFCAGRLARYKLPKEFVRVAEIPRQPSGKPDYRTARDLLGLAQIPGQDGIPDSN